MKRLRRSDEPQSLNGKSVHIVGPSAFQNALLADILAAATGVACHLHASMQELPELPASDRRCHLVLEDYLSLEIRGFDGSHPREPAMSLPRTLVSLFNVPGDWGLESTALRRGVRGLFYVHDVPETLVKGVRHIFAGELWVSRKAIAASFEESDQSLAAQEALPEGLTPREREILRLVAEGASNDMVAEQACISAHTVKTHLHNAYRKISVKNRIQAARWAAKNLV